MKNISHKKKWNVGTVQGHVNPPSIPPIKINNDDKSDKYLFWIQFRRNPTPENLDLYKFKMAFFDNGDPE